MAESCSNMSYMIIGASKACRSFMVLSYDVVKWILVLGTQP